MSMVVGRLAPSPTGAQHVGNARTYLLAWLAARSRGGRVILRIEDVDSPRVKRGADRQAIDDLHWLGLDWDEGPDAEGRHSPYVQSKRLQMYKECLDQLRRDERVYPCTCSRKDVLEAASAPHLETTEPVYPGTCSGRSAAEAAGLDRPFSWRFRTSATPISFFDEVAGEQTSAAPNFGGDFVVWKQDETPAYQLAVTVDDHLMGITQVVRGDDLIPSTFRQISLYQAFGWRPPSFAHAPLVVGVDGRRLAKRHGDTRLETLRESGVSAEALVGLLAWSAGLAADRRPGAARALLSNFTLASLPRKPFVLTAELLNEIGYCPPG